jgi:hypothetical protein
MKSLAFIFLLLGSLGILFSQDNILPIDSETGQITYSEVVYIEGINSDILYQRANLWFVYTFKSANHVIQMNDKEAGKIIGKGNFSVRWGYVDFTIEIQVKDDRYKYTLSGLRYEPTRQNVYSHGDLTQEKPGGGIMTMGGNNWRKIKQEAHAEAILLIDSIKKSMAINNDNSDEW